MKRDFDEISEEEWSQHSFNASRVLKRPRTPKKTRAATNPTPSIESFAFRRPSTAMTIESNSSDGDCVEIEDLGDSDSDVKIVNGEDLLLEDEEEVEETKVVMRAARVGRRFVIEDEEASDDDDDEAESSASEDEFGGGGGGSGGRRGEDEDVVGKALQKCAKISADLRKELYGTSSGVTDRYSEVETSTVRIVTQVLEIITLVFLK